MHDATITRVSHSHDTGSVNPENERRTLQVVILTITTMAVEVAAGYVTGSMALLADGWHMGTHAFALGISYAAYLLARKHAESGYFSFGTGKFGVLAGYTSALFLGAVALWMIIESTTRFFHPVNIAFNEAILVASIGLVVNVVSIFILHDKGTHDHHHEHSHDHEHDHSHHDHHDHNYRAAYLHVIADALTSILAIIALLSGRFLGWNFLDPVMGIVGGILICRWSFQLTRSTLLILLDGGVDRKIHEMIREAVESDNESRIADLHLWRISSHEMAVVISVVTGRNRTAEEFLARLKGIPDITHMSVEVHTCDDVGCECE